MNVSTFVIDGFLLLIFLSAWKEATDHPAYRSNGWRFLRAASMPLAICIFWHYIVLFGWSENPIVLSSAVVVAIMGVEPAIVLLPDYIVAQLTSASWNTKPEIAEPRGLESYLNSTEEGDIEK